MLLPNVRPLKNPGYGVSIELTANIGVEIAVLLPKEELEVRNWNFAGGWLFIGPVVLFGFEISADRTSVVALNSYLSIFYEGVFR